ncbi:MAG: PD40 domain-containing protein, partial [Planctomycetes bacterium]|nr:PD40 domain-containing protein [Planctomycetota bacterium]
GMATEDGTSDLYTWHPERAQVPPEPAYGLNTGHNELAPAVGPDGRVWFASDRPEAIGGYDLFTTTWTPRGFGRIDPVPACNTAFDETDPAPDPFGASVVFVRIDRAIDDGDDGVLYRWLLGDPLDPVMVFPDQRRRRERVIDRDPAFAPDGASLWFVRKVRGQPLQICRSSRLGDAFDHPVALSEAWGTRSLRSPVPLADGRSVGFVQPAVGDEPALWFVAHAQELMPWWPGQRWLEWLCLSLIGCSLLLLLLLYLGQRWSALDLVAQCLLLSLLLHVLLFLWLMGVEIAGSLLPGSDDDDSGMQVSIVASAGYAAASSSGGGGDVAAKVRRSVAERAFEVAEPGTATARSELDAQRSLAVDHGAYEAEPTADPSAQAAASELADAAPELQKRDGVDAVGDVRQAQLDSIEQVQLAADAAAARAAAADPAADARVVQVVSPGSGVARAAPRVVALAPADASAAMPLRAEAARTTDPSAPAMQDDASAAALAATGDAPDAAPAPVGMTSEAALAAAPASAVVAAPQRGASETRDDAVEVAVPGSAVGRPATRH